VAPAAETVDYSQLAVVRETKFASKEYGQCFACGEPVVIPGLSHSLCGVCGWVKRPVEARSEEAEEEALEGRSAGGHHD
jgi:hypothetical protein